MDLERAIPAFYGVGDDGLVDEAKAHMKICTMANSEGIKRNVYFM